MEFGNYYFDLDVIIDFIEGGYDNKTEISETYVTDDETEEIFLAGKTITETKGGDTTKDSTIRYDLMKMFLTSLLTIEATNKDNLTFGETAIINTLLKKGIIKENENNG